MDRENQLWVAEARHAFGDSSELERLHRESIAMSAKAVLWSRIATIAALISLAAFAYRFFLMPSCS